MTQLKNEFCLTCLPRSQSILMIARVAEQKFRNWLKIFLTYLDINALDVEDIMEVKLYGLNYLCIIPFQGSKEKQSIALSECRTLTIKFVIIGNTVTSIEKQVYGNLNVLCEHVENNLRSTNWIMGWKILAVEKNYSKQLPNLTTKQKS